MKYSLSLLLPLLLSSASARTSIHRYLEANAPIFLTNAVAGSSSGSGGSPFGSGMDSPDISCTMSMAMDFDSCAAAVDANGVNCVWCSLGGDLGGCVGSDIADMVNSAEIPHLQCGIKTLSAEDEVFFDDLKSCIVQGDTADACHGSSVTADGTPCTWCVTVNAPFFATCFSEAFVTEAQDLDAATDMLSSVVDCSPQAPKDVGAITDMHCVTDGNPGDEFMAGVCTQTMDAQGNPCVVANLFGMMDVCVTDTQKATLDYLVDQMNMMGIADPMSVFGGEPGSVGEDGAFVDGDGEEIYAVPLYVESSQEEEATVVAEKVNNEEEIDEDEEESGQ